MCKFASTCKINAFVAKIVNTHKIVNMRLMKVSLVSFALAEMLLTSATLAGTVPLSHYITNPYFLHCQP